MATPVHDGVGAGKPTQIGLESGASLMGQGPEALFDLMATKFETALGRPMPQMDIRFKNLSLTANIVVANSGSKHELPTIPNTLKKVFAPSKGIVQKEILKNVSGVFRPGTITLLLGQPGSGKSALMKTLSGRFPMKKNIELVGDITYNGVPQRQITQQLPQFTSYVSQRDKHSAPLTVKESLEFAHTFCGGELARRAQELLSNGTPEQNAEAQALAKAVFTHYPDVVIEQLGLQICQNTIVGDAMMRGVSGGERKRVTTGEMEFGLKYVSLMDEVSTGLDSAATFDIICTQRDIAKKLRRTVVIALLQPAPEVFALFDDVMILNDGELMYHGPCDRVVDYFEGAGFHCPPDRDIADYLLDLGTAEQYRYQKTMTNQQHPRTASEYAALFRESTIHHDMLALLDAPHGQELLQTAELHMKAMPRYHQSFWESTLTVFRRQLMIIYRNKPFVLGRVMMVAIMGLLYCSTFYSFDPTQISVVMGVIFSAIMFLSMGQASQIPVYFAERDIFYKQRGANFYRTFSYVMANSIAQIPMAIVETLVFSCLVYWVCGFQADAGKFFIFIAMVLLCNLTMGMWFFCIAAYCPNDNVATPFGQASILLFVLFAGFIVTKSQIPDYLIWIHWISPLSWAIKALAINEYRSPEFDVCVYGEIDYCATYNGLTMGEYYLSMFDIVTDRVWIVYGFIYIIVLYFVFLTLSYLTLEYHRHEAPENVGISEKEGDVDTYTLAETPKNSGSGSYAVDVQEHKNFVPVTIAFEDLWYSVPDPKNPKESLELLKGISGFAVPGSITALMGSTGAGKTTLMDVIAGRKTGGKITGKILLNGYPATPLAIQRCTGYCEQMDIHSETATIREALTFSSFLRQDSTIPASKKMDSVEECLDLLGLRDIADQIIRGSSVEQMKRLTIGVELAAQPSVIFLDEPTSGLDARSAKLIMDGVRKVADSGRTIVCTIHQPSADVFYLFDSLLLLKRGGQTVYFGELGKDCRNMIDYFEAIPGVTPLPERYNPATWMLECIGAGVISPVADDRDFVKLFNESAHKDVMTASMYREGIMSPSPDYPELVFQEKRAADSKTQLKFLVARFMRLYWRTPSYNLTRIGVSLFLGILFGIVFVDADYASYQGLNSGVGMVFMASLFQAMISFQSVMPMTCEERAAYYRERAAQTYNAFYYFVGATVAEIPFVIVSAFVFTIIFYPMVGFTDATSAVLFCLCIVLLVMMQTFMGQMFCYALPGEAVAMIIGVLINSIFFLFMGFSPPAYAIPSGYRWLYKIVPQRFTLSILVSLVFANCDQLPDWDEELQQYVNVGSQLGCQPMSNSPATVGHITLKEYTEQYFEMKHDEILQNFFIVIAYIIFFRILALLALRYINHQKK